MKLIEWISQIIQFFLKVKKPVEKVAFTAPPYAKLDSKLSTASVPLEEVAASAVNILGSLKMDKPIASPLVQEVDAEMNNKLEDAKKELEAMELAEEAAKKAAELAEVEANKSRALKKAAEEQRKKTQAEADRLKAELEVELDNLKNQEALARQAEIDKNLAETRSNIIRAKFRKLDAERTTDALKKVEEELSEITDEEVFCGTQFTVGGDAVVWVFKRIGTDVVLVRRKVIKQR